jgi:hypothetical protein
VMDSCHPHPLQTDQIYTIFADPVATPDIDMGQGAFLPIQGHNPEALALSTLPYLFGVETASTTR